LKLVQANGNTATLRVVRYSRSGNLITVEFAPVDRRAFGGAAVVRISTGKICVEQFE